MSIKTAAAACASLIFVGTSAHAWAGESCSTPEHSIQKQSQTAELPRYVVPYSWNSGLFDGRLSRASSSVAEDVISVAGAPWIQLELGDVSLGKNSHVVLTSVQDGHSQKLDAQALDQWKDRTAYFNGDSVRVELYVDPSDVNVTFNVASVVAGERLRPSGPLPMSICGRDNRVASNEPRVARIDPIGCTAWIIRNGKLLTAGHCLARGSRNRIISFNPPASLPDGTVQFPGPEDQYTINQGSFVFADGGVGNDWGVFTAARNSQTGLRPIDAQGSFRIQRNRGPSRIRITGFGVDSGRTNQTNQTHVGDNAGSSGTTMRYTADTTGGNSGSPIIDARTGISVGIHSHGGCSAVGGRNSGTSFFNSALVNAINR